jgi:hypothetical protein
MPQLKYVRCKEFDTIIIFPEFLQHSDFRKFEPISAGFCQIQSDPRKIVCYGQSISLGLLSQDEDSDLATRQFFRDY